MLDIFITLGVLKDETSITSSSLQPLNILLILVTQSVVNEDTSRVVSDEQPLNIEAIFVTLEVSKLLPKTIPVRCNC